MKLYFPWYRVIFDGKEKTNCRIEIKSGIAVHLKVATAKILW